MSGVARWTTTHRWQVVVGWIALVIAVIALGRAAGTSYSNNFTLPSSDAQRASDLLQASFPAQAGDRDQIVVRVSSGSVLDSPARARVSAMLEEVARLPHVASVQSPYGSTPSAAISADGKIAFATVVFDRRANLVPKRAVEAVIDTARGARGSGLQVELGGLAIETTQRAGFGVATAVGLLAAVVVLLLTFGSLVATGLPIITALFGLGSGLGAIALFTHVVETPNFSSELAAMIGLGVGIDYALFILTRFREAYATPGPTFGDARESVVQAMDTAGRAVLFAGCTVVVALLGMMLLGVSFLYGVAISASIGVLLVMLASLTMLPALLAFAGGRLARPSRRARARAVRGGVRRAGAWQRWSAFVQRRPWKVAAVATVVMLIVAAPATALRLGSSDASNDRATQTTHRAYELLAAGFGIGFNGPLLIVAKLAHVPAEAAAQGVPLGAAELAAFAHLRSAVSASRDVLAVTAPHFNSRRDIATFTVYPRSSPQAYSTTRLVGTLRDHVIPPIASRARMVVYVGGVTAGGIDFATVLGHKLPLFIGVVVLVSALLLLLVFRSLVIPLQAAAMNLLSITASLGVIVAVFQWGWLAGPAGIEPGPIESFIPVMLFAIVFGLSMDYEVFLVSRIHERWTHTRDESRAVAEGLALTGRVVTAAAAIMVCVFLSFMLGGDRVVKEFGLSLASAVFLDALVVRCLLLPALLHILGERTWRLPAWLERPLPRMRIEGAAAPSEVAEPASVLVPPHGGLASHAQAATGQAEG